MICEMTKVERIEKFLQEQRLHWLDHVKRMGKERGPVKTLHLTLKGSIKGRPKKRWKEVVEQDVADRGLKRTDAQDCMLWRLGCKNRLTPACREVLPCFRKMKETKFHS